MTKGARKELLLLLKKCVMCGIINSQINKNLTVCKVLLRICKVDVVVFERDYCYNKVTITTGGFYYGYSRKNN